MKKVYRILLKYVENIVTFIEIKKTFVFEIISIIRKRNIYKHIKWNKDQKKLFNDFWKENYGKKISPRWHKLYQAVNGIFNVKYFPEYLYTTKLEPMWNDYSFAKCLCDKSVVEVLCQGINVKVPQTLVVCSGGVFKNEKRDIINKERATDLLKDAGDIVIKPSLGGSSGYGVEILSIKNGIDVASGKTIEEIMNAYGKDFIVQRKIKPCEILKKIYPDAINTLRITTYVCDGYMNHVPIALRMGSNGAKVDNIHAGGIGIALRDTGELFEQGYRLGYGDQLEKFIAHPDTGVVFGKVILKETPDIIKIAYELHGKLPRIGCVSWDFTIEDSGDIVLIEYNLWGQGVWFPQMISGEGLFGQNTKSILKLM